MSNLQLGGRALAAIMALTLLAAPLSAQDEDNSGPMTWGEDAQYVAIYQVAFKPGKRERAMQLIEEYFQPADKKAGLPGPVVEIHYQTGKWDVVAAWVLKGGTADLEWYRSEDDVKWYGALAEIAGGEDKAGAIMDEWSSLVASEFVELGHIHTGQSD